MGNRFYIVAQTTENRSIKMWYKNVVDVNYKDIV